MDFYFSFIIPVYNRPQEVEELLESFTKLDYSREYEILIVEDGSTISSEKIVNTYSKSLPLTYFFKENSGPGLSRNFGMQKAKGNYFIILDSDCLVPSHYLKTVEGFLKQNYYDCYGGADAAHSSFSSIQKAINFTMTSFITTGGIRGNKKSVNRFEPRSFNMGISKKAFTETGGYGKIHPGEDPDLSQRILKKGFNTTFIPNAYVYHKRRISWKKFYTQVKKFGLVRPILNKWHPQSSKITFWFPFCFVVFVTLSILLSLGIHWQFFIPLAVYMAMVFVSSAITNKSVYIGLLSILALFIQFFGYGIAFFKSSYYIRFLNRNPEKQFPFLFFN